MNLSLMQSDEGPVFESSTIIFTLLTLWLKIIFYQFLCDSTVHYACDIRVDSLLCRNQKTTGDLLFLSLFSFNKELHDIGMLGCAEM